MIYFFVFLFLSVLLSCCCFASPLLLGPLHVGKCCIASWQGVHIGEFARVAGTGGWTGAVDDTKRPAADWNRSHGRDSMARGSGFLFASWSDLVSQAADLQQDSAGS